MSMFCYQCQEASKGTGCSKHGVCGKDFKLAGLQDLLIYTTKGICVYSSEARKLGITNKEIDEFVIETMFSTITNGNWSTEFFANNIKRGLLLRDEIKNAYHQAGGTLGKSSDSFFNKIKNALSSSTDEKTMHDATTWSANSIDAFYAKAASDTVGVLATPNEDIRSLRELITYGVKGMCAYLRHANVLGFNDDNINAFIQKALAATLDDTISADDYVALTLEAGKYSVDTMALLDSANTSTYGNPEITKVNIGTKSNPGILISGHDLKDLEDLLKQSQGSGVDIYTHGEMLPAHYYPAFKKYDNFVGNYGNAWHMQTKEFESFNGPIIMTTNCLVPPKDSYKDRLFTTGYTGFDGVCHIKEQQNGHKDFTKIIEMAKKCKAPIQIEEGEIIGGFAHNQVLALADSIVDAIKTGAIKRFFVMGGCDGRMKSRDYYTDFAKNLPKDAVILTAGCAKYKYNKLNLGDINGIPRVLDAGQCNDCYSLAVIALKLKEVFELEDINALPISFNIAWYEQKAVTVLLALLHLGVKNIHLGPTLPAFLSPNVANILIENFGIGGITDVKSDIDMFMNN